MSSLPLFYLSDVFFDTLHHLSLLDLVLVAPLSSFRLHSLDFSLARGRSSTQLRSFLPLARDYHRLALDRDETGENISLTSLFHSFVRFRSLDYNSIEHAFRHAIPEWHNQRCLRCQRQHHTFPGPKQIIEPWCRREPFPQQDKMLCLVSTDDMDKIGNNI